MYKVVTDLQKQQRRVVTPGSAIIVSPLTSLRLVPKHLIPRGKKAEAPLQRAFKYVLSECICRGE